MSAVYLYSMQCELIKLRRQGVALGKYDIRKETARAGELTIYDTNSDGQNRTVKLAKFVHESKIWGNDVLYDVEIVWMSEHRFTLKGFEQIAQDGKKIAYAQSWLCRLILLNSAKTTYR